MEYFLLFSIWIAAAFFFPIMFRKIQIPWVNAVILAGILLGPSGFRVVYPGEVTDFLATIGLVFLMFTAGLDIKFSVLKKTGRKVVIFTVFNFAIPLVTGFLVGFFLGLSSFSSLILGVCFSSSSVAIVVPTLKELKVKSTIRSTLTSAIFLEDIASLVLISVLLHATAPISSLPLPFFLGALFLFIVIVLYFTPILQEWLLWLGPKKDGFAGELRSVLITVSIVALMAEIIGVHAMVGGFLAGLTLSELLERRGGLETKILAFSYGFFIPLFLFNVGMTTNLGTLFEPKDALLTCLIIVSLVISKSASGFLGARLVGFPFRTSLGIGILTAPQMSTTLATASLAVKYGIFSESLLGAMVVLSIITITVCPLLTKFVLPHDVMPPESPELSKFGKQWLGTRSPSEQDQKNVLPHDAMPPQSPKLSKFEKQWLGTRSPSEQDQKNEN